MSRIGLAALSTTLFAARLSAQAPDPVLARIEALEAKVNALEARNRELEAAAAARPSAPPQAQSQAQAAASPVALPSSGPPPRVAQGVSPGVLPTFAAPAPNITVIPRAVMQFDYAAYDERAGGYRYNDGTDIRRGRFGLEGTAFTDFRYRINAEFVKNQVNLLDAFIQYVGIPRVTITVGQHKVPYSLEANDLDWLNTFLERGMATDTFIGVGADRRVGASIGYEVGAFDATVGIYGAGEAVTRNAATPGEVRSVNGRVTWEPKFGERRQVHVGAAGYHVASIAAKTLTLSDRPESRVDSGLLESVAIGPVAGLTRGVRTADLIGGEGALVLGSFSVQSEYAHLTVHRYDGAPTLDFDGYYAFASLFLTGEARSFRGGLLDRLRPAHNFSLHGGGIGAIEVAVRYDRLDLGDPALSPLDRVATSLTGGLNWYLNPNTRLLFNWIHFKGTNSPMAVAPAAINGTTAKGDVYATRVQFDF